MRDVHTEMIVPIVPQTVDKVMQVTLKVLMWLTVALGILVGWLFFILTGVFYLFYNFQKRRTDSEYEYLHSNDSFTIDLVIAGKKRKQLLSLDLDRLIVVAPQDSESLQSFRNMEAKDYTGNSMDMEIYEIVYTTDRGRKKIAICMNEALHKSIKQWIPSAVK